MSSGAETPLENDSSRDERTQRTDPGGTRPPNLIEFVNSQDPNVRSAIQRHTAYHSAAQRRDARSRLLRRSSQSRYLEWGRRPPRGDADTTTTSSASSASISPAPSTERPRQSGTSSNPTDQESETSQSRSDSIVEMELSQPPPLSTPQDDPIIQFYSSTFCHHNTARGMLDAAVAYMFEHEAPRHLLLAYAYAMRWKLHASPETVQDQVDAQSHLSRGTNVLWNRLQSSAHSSSDAVIQAVLLLLVYTADFGQMSEMRLHQDALRTMLNQRGGINAFGHNPTLQQQLWAIETSRAFHLTFGCEASCTSELRFPDGLRLRPEAQNV